LQAPGNIAHNPTLIKIPADEETVVVLEKVGLWRKRVSTHPNNSDFGAFTISAIAAICMNAANPAKMAMTPHPCSRRCLPPHMRTANATIVMPSITTAKVIKKATDRHMLQKYLPLP
jgi:hypothetical protein